MELGGKNPAIVFADANLDVVAAGLARSVFENTGQVCLGTERVYVQRPVFDAVVQRWPTPRVPAPGRPTDAGRQLRAADLAEHQAKVLGYYQLARDEGADIVCGGGVPDMPDALRGGAWIEPTVWTGLPMVRVVQRRNLRPLLPRDARSTPKKRRCAWPTTRPTAWPPRSTPATSTAPTASPQARSAWCGSTPGSCATCARPSAAPAVGHGPRRRRAFARVLYRAVQRLHQAGRSRMHEQQQRDQPPQRSACGKAAGTGPGHHAAARAISRHSAPTTPMPFRTSTPSAAEPGARWWAARSA
jgi:hypothetical protein